MDGLGFHKDSSQRQKVEKLKNWGHCGQCSSRAQGQCETQRKPAHRRSSEFSARSAGTLRQQQGLGPGSGDSQQSQGGLWLADPLKHMADTLLGTSRGWRGEELCRERQSFIQNILN